MLGRNLRGGKLRYIFYIYLRTNKSSQTVRHAQPKIFYLGADTLIALFWMRLQ